MSEEELNEEEQEELNSHPIIIETEEKELKYTKSATIYLTPFLFGGSVAQLVGKYEEKEVAEDMRSVMQTYFRG